MSSNGPKRLVHLLLPQTGPTSGSLQRLRTPWLMVSVVTRDPGTKRVNPTNLEGFRAPFYPSRPAEALSSQASGALNERKVAGSSFRD